MSYIELWRIHGGFSFFAVMSMLIFLFWKNRSDANVIAYGAYLAVCAVDPFLMTSTGFLMIMYMFYLYMSSVDKVLSNSYLSKIEGRNYD